MHAVDQPAGRVVAGALKRLTNAMRWRRRRAQAVIGRALGESDIQWARVVMDRVTEEFARKLPYGQMDALEISGAKWSGFGFRSYCGADYPAYDVCEGPLQAEGFDIIIAEQVLEHVLWPYRAVRHVWQMLRPNGYFLVTTPFLVRIHNHPVDCCRWTELGMKHLLAEGGFELSRITTGSWGNRACVKGNFRTWRNWIGWKHSLKNEPNFPVVVWAFARKGSE